MNTSSPDSNKPDSRKENFPMMHFGGRQVGKGTIYLTLGFVATVIFVVISTLSNSHRLTPPPVTTPQQKIPKVHRAVSPEHRATDKLITKLKQFGLWKINPESEVPPFFIESFPTDLGAVGDISLRKRVFLHSLLPHALFVRQEVLRKRDRLESILNKIDCPLEDIDFSTGLDYESRCSWSDFLAEDEVSFIESLSRNYRTTVAENLLARVDAVPISIILAQGALESSWGGSRFTREGNSIFGMWTWKTKGMIPARREEGKTHRVKTYENILDSVRAYQLTINRLDPYEEFRQLRKQTDDPLIMAEGLTLYSERGEEYIEEIKKVILSNNLQRYESCSLSDIGLPEFSGPVTKTSVVTGYGKTSL